MILLFHLFKNWYDISNKNVKMMSFRLKFLIILLLHLIESRFILLIKYPFQKDKLFLYLWNFMDFIWIYNIKILLIYL